MFGAIKGNYYLLDIKNQFESANEAHPGRSLCCIEDVQLIGAALPIISTEEEDFVPLESRIVQVFAFQIFSMDAE